MRRRSRQGGFTLVELAIVLLIIGLIVGGILQGQELIKSARLNDVQTTMNSIRASTNTFRDKFVALPGDISNAGLIADEADGTGGNGDSRIGAESSSDWTSGEPKNYWGHLAAAGLLTGVNGGDVLDAGSLSPSNGLSASIGGYYKIKYHEPSFAGGGTSVDSSVGHWVLLSNNSGPSSSNEGGVFSSVDLRSIDIKTDDGKPLSGDVLGNGDGDPSCRDGEDYNNAEGDSACTGWFKM